MSAVSVTYTFTNATTSDATQVNQNFTDIVNGLSDGSKDLTVLSVSTPTLTVSGLASGRVPYTTTGGLITSGTGLTYNGSAFSVTGTGAFSGNATVGGILGVTGVTTATGGLTLGASFVDKTTSLTSNTTLTTAHSTIFASASGGSFTITLPAASGNTGLTYTIYKTDVSAAATGGGNTVTIDGNASETIGGSTTQVLASNTGNGVLKIICDGSNWRIQELLDEGTYVSTLTGFASSPTTASSFSRNRNAVIVNIRSATNTSNASDMTITGMPSVIYPTNAQYGMSAKLYDSGNQIPGTVDLSTSGVFTCYPYDASTSLATFGAFASSLTKGVLGVSIAYYK